MYNHKSKPGYSQKQLVLLLSLALSFIATCAPSQAKDIYKNAVTLYDKGHHDRAKRYFHHIIKHKPEHWQSHYYLATIHMKNNDLVLARKYYNSCVVNYPDVATCKMIVKALKLIDQKERLGRNTEIAKTTEPSEDSDEDTEKPNLTDEQKKRIALLEKIKASELAAHEKQKKIVEDRKASIMADAEKRANEAIAQGEREIADLQRNTNWYVKNTRTGVVSVGVPSVVANQIRDNARRRASRIREIGHQRVKGIKIPKAPRLTNSVAHQLTATPTKSGTQLHHVGTNLYVRNYIHKSNENKKRKVAASKEQKTF